MTPMMIGAGFFFFFLTRLAVFFAVLAVDFTDDLASLAEVELLFFGALLLTDELLLGAETLLSELLEGAFGAIALGASPFETASLFDLL